VFIPGIVSSRFPDERYAAAIIRCKGGPPIEGRSVRAGQGHSLTTARASVSATCWPDTSAQFLGASLNRRGLS
jgi:hypothetical protein